MVKRKERPKEKVAFVNHEGETVYIALTGPGRKCILKQPIVMQFPVPVQVRRIVVNYMPQKFYKTLMKDGPGVKKNEPEQRKNESQVGEGPQGRPANAGTGDMPSSKGSMPVVDGWNADNRPQKEGDD